MNNNKSIFKFILDYFNAIEQTRSAGKARSQRSKKSKQTLQASPQAVVFKKYKEFLNNYNVYNLYKITVIHHYDYLIYYLESNMGNNSDLFYNNDTEIFRNLINLEIKLKKFYKYRDRVSSQAIPNFNLFIFLPMC